MIKDLEIVQQKVLAYDANYGITDVIDCVVRYKDNLMVVNIQPVSNDEFLAVQKKGALRRHVVEIMIQMWLTEIQGGILIYENRDNNDFVMFHVKEYGPVIESVKKKCRLMVGYKVKGSLPDRPYQYKNRGEECRECEFVGECWNKGEKHEKT